METNTFAAKTGKEDAWERAGPITGKIIRNSHLPKYNFSIPSN